MKADEQAGGPEAWIFAVIGLVIGALGGTAGFLIGAAAGYALGLVLQQKTQIGRLQARLLALEQSPEAVAAQTPSAASLGARMQAAAEAQKAAAASAAIATAASVPAPAPANTPPPARPTPPPLVWTPSPPNALEAAISKAWDWLRGGNPIAKIGVVILFFGAVFLVKYAADHSMLPIELRFAALAAGALALLVMGWRLRLAKPGYAQILQGGGVAGLYLVSFAAARIFQLLPMPLALAVMVAVAVFAAVLAIAQESLALAVIGTGGGFLAPILLSTGQGSHIALFSYYAILNIGVFTVAWFRAWRVLNLMGFFFTFGVVGVFRGTRYVAENLISADLFLGLFFLLYVAVSVLFALRQKPDLKGYVSASLVFGLPVAAFGIHASLWHAVPYALAWSALGLGAFYIALAAALWNIHRSTLRILCEAFAALGVIFVSLAVPLAFDENAIAAIWAVEGAGLMWLGVRQDRKLARAFSAFLQVLGTLSFLHHLDTPADAPLIINGQCIGLLVLGASTLLTGYWLRRPGVAIPKWETGWSLVAVVLGSVWISFAGLAEIARVFPALLTGLSLVFMALLALGWQALARRLAWPLLDHLALALMIFVALYCVDQDTTSASAHPFALAGWLGWPLWCAAQYRQLWRREPDAPWLKAQHIATGLWLLLLLSWEGTWQVQSQQPAGFWQWLPSAIVIIATLTMLARPQLRPTWPAARHAQTYRQGIGWPVAALAAAWLLLANLGSSGNAAPLPTWPLLNPLDIASIGLLLTLGRYWLQTASRQQLPFNKQVLLAAAAALVFLWMNSALLRGLHYGLGTPLLGQGAMQSTLLQATFSVFWSLLAFTAMALAARHRLRPVWFVGAALMVVVVVKLFVVDTAGSGTLARIVAFFSVGGMLLVTGYFSPLPPAVSAATEPSA